MDTASAYIPMDWRQAIAKGETLPEWQDGAVLFADISGFTPLTEALARELGPKRGAEELTIHLNNVYDALITELHRLGGSVISFSGDAITCWFNQDLDGRMATACGLAMQEAMQQFAQIKTHSGNTVSLGMKAAAAIGRVRRFIIGMPEYVLMDAMAGKTLESMVAAEHEAERGDVVLDEPTAEALADYLEISEWRTNDEGQRFAVVTALNVEIEDNPWPPLTDDDLSEEQRQAWLLPPVYDRLQSGRGEFLAELRPAAALFMRFTGIDYDNDPHAAEKLDIFMRRVQQIIGHQEGSLLQLTIGDKGSYMYAAFGAPAAHEDDVDRALSAALALRTLPDQFDYIEPMQMGVTYGRMRVGAYGGTKRRTYGVLGDAVNLSARLMTASTPGEVFVSEDAKRRASRSFVWEDLQPIKVKGKTELVSLSRLVRARQRRSGETLDTQFMAPLVGRMDIMAQLGQLLAKTTSGEGQIVRIIGEAGMGKSHLVAQFIQRVLEQGLKVSMGACLSITRNTPYAPWRQIFYKLLDLEDASESVMIANLREKIEVQNPEWALRLPLLGDLLALPIPENPTTAAMDSEVRQKSLFSLLGEMISSWAEEPLILVIEDIQWMDEVSKSLTETIAQQAISAAPVMLLLVQRPEVVGDDAILAELRKHAFHTDILLSEMSEADIATLIRTRLGGRLSKLLAEIVQGMTRGNPFFANELTVAMRRENKILQNENHVWEISEDLLNVLRRADFVAQREGEWHLRDSVDFSAVKLGVPDSIHGLILSRLDRLPEPHKLTLKVSSVIGHYIDLALVSLAHPEDKPITEIESEVRFMEAEEVVNEEFPERLIYVFRHHTLQEVTYDTLLFTQRQQLHRSISEALLQQQPDAVTQIAHHSFLGELWVLALEYNVRAGEQAKQLHANQQSIDFFQKALESAQHLPQSDTAEERKHIHLSLGELLVSTGQYDQANEHLKTALALSREQNDPHYEARCCRWFGRSHEVRGEYAVAMTWLNRGFGIVEGMDSLEEAELSLVAGLINYRQGNFDEALAVCERGLRVNLSLEDAAIRGRLYNVMGAVKLRNDPDHAIDLFRQSLELQERLGNIFGQATSYNLIANWHFARSEWQQADEFYRRALDMFTQTGNIYNQVVIGNNLGGIAQKQGRLEAALAYYQRTLRRLEQIGGSLWIFGVLHMNLGNTYLYMKDLREAVEQLELSLAYFEQAQVRDFLPEVYGIFAETKLRQGDLHTAVDYGQRSLETARELSMPREEGHNLRILGEISLAEHKPDEAKLYFDQSVQVLGETDDVYEQAKTQLALAMFYMQQNDQAAAVSALDICQPRFEQLGATLEVASAQALRQQLNGAA